VKSPRKLLEPLLQDVVIIRAMGVDRDRRRIGARERLQRIMIGPVIHRDDKRAAGLGPERAGMTAPGLVGLHPVHLAMAAFGDEFRQTRTGLPGLIRTRHAGRVETERARLVLQRRRGRRRV